MPKATFYTVNGPRAVYYAVVDHQTGRVWTERTELAARDQARDEGLELDDEEQTISHAELVEIRLHLPVPTVTAPGQVATPAVAAPSLKVESGISRFFRRLRRDNHAASTESAAR